MWLKSKLDKDWVVQQINGEKVENIDALKQLLIRHQGKKVTITAVRDYSSKEFVMKVPKL